MKFQVKRWEISWNSMDTMKIFFFIFGLWKWQFRLYQKKFSVLEGSFIHASLEFFINENVISIWMTNVREIAKIRRDLKCKIFKRMTLRWDKFMQKFLKDLNPFLKLCTYTYIYKLPAMLHGKVSKHNLSIS